MTNLVSALWNHFINHLSQRPRRRDPRHVQYNNSRRRRRTTQDEDLAKRLQEIEDFEYARHLQQEENDKEQLTRQSVASSLRPENGNVLTVSDEDDDRFCEIERRRSLSEENNSLPFQYISEQLHRNHSRLPYEGHRLHQSLYNIRGDRFSLMMDDIDSTMQQIEPCLRAWSLSDLDNPPMQPDSILQGPRPYDTHSYHNNNTTEVSPVDDYFIYNDLYPGSLEGGDTTIVNSCTICLSDIDQNSNDDIKCLPCMHIFHEECIDQWLNENDSCPVCRVSASN